MGSFTKVLDYITFEEYLKFINKKLNESSDLLKQFIIRNKNKVYDINRTQSFNKYCGLYEQYLTDVYGEFYEKYNKYINKLNEGLILSDSRNNVINKLVKFVTNKQIFIDVDNIDNYISPVLKQKIGYIGFVLYTSDYIKYEKEFDSIFNICGYYIAEKQYINEDQSGLYIQIEPKYLFNCTDYIYNETDGILYHITLGKLYNKIKNNGLIPKAHNKKVNHPERIYMIEPGNYNYNDFIIQAFNLYKPNNVYIDNVKKYLDDNGKLDIVVLKIDLKKYYQYHDIFKDPNHADGVFIYNNIHPKCINILQNFKI